MRPSQRNKINADLKKAKSDLETWRKAADCLKPGTLRYARASNEMDKAQDRINSCNDQLAQR